MNAVRRTTFLNLYKAAMLASVKATPEKYSPSINVDKYIDSVERVMIATDTIPFMLGVSSVAAMKTLKIKQTKKALMTYLNGEDNYS
jgi:hypothetical protein